MKKLNTVFIFVFTGCLLHINLHSGAQSPIVKQWDYRFGGTDNDVVTCFEPTSDGGYILGGYSFSGIGGDKTQDTIGSFDYWIIKTDSLGNKQWDKDFGGPGNDYLFSLQQTSDGGYILGGYSNSGIGGNKTQAGQGNYDFWIIKTDGLGNQKWDKDFGGPNIEYLYSIQQTYDGGYIMGGPSASGIGGDKTEPLKGLPDYWIIKTDSLGIKQWDKDFGGSNVNNLLAIRPTADHGFILGGYSNSTIGGDKSQNSWGAEDYWIVKTDSTGRLEWDRDFGGTGIDFFSSLQPTLDGGYILGGFSNSPLSGNKTQNTLGDYDYWVVKIDAAGNQQWDKDFGGTAGDELLFISQTSDGGYLLSGESYSSAGGDKSENNLGIEQAWLLKTDSVGTKQWDKTALTPGHDENSAAIQTSDGCYTLVNRTDGGIGGHKTQPSRGGFDYWMAKFCDSTTTGTNLAFEGVDDIRIFPNPFMDELTIIRKQPLINATMQLFDMYGQLIFSQPLTTNNIKINKLPDGIYLVQVTTLNKVVVKRVVKQN